jgi:hypothetical protein
MAPDAAIRPGPLHAPGFDHIVCDSAGAIPQIAAPKNGYFKFRGAGRYGAF